MEKRPSPWPRGKKYDLLRSFLRHEKHTIDTAFLKLNCGVLSARSAELRKMGWPINANEMPHPTLLNETCMQYSMDAHFLYWWGDGKGKHPFDYKPKAGRGKFIEEENAVQNAHTPYAKRDADTPENESKTFSGGLDAFLASVEAEN